MAFRNNTFKASLPAATSGMDSSEELLAEVDEPPDEEKNRSTWASPKLQPHSSFAKASAAIYQRRESLLTRQLHSETEHTDEEDSTHPPPRTLSTQSTWSNPSVASTAELTSDDGHSVASPAVSPPLPPTAIGSIMPITEKPLTKEPAILGRDDKVADIPAEKTVEAGLGRKRCISFACGNKDKRPPTSQPKEPPAAPAPVSNSSPPKRKCMLKFVCPTRSQPEPQPPMERANSARRITSPPPPERRPSKGNMKAHRGSDSTVTHASPKASRKSPAVVTTAPTPTTTTAPPLLRRRVSDDSDASTEATRFHEFASSDDEPEEWVQESTCHRSRLTVMDTLKKETVIRQACEEVEEEVVQEEDEEDEIEEDLRDDDDEDEEDGEDEEDMEVESDDGFRTDDEEGFAESDSEAESDDGDWWRPGGRSTAATSIDHLDRLPHAHANAKPADTAICSSVGSASSSHISPRPVVHKGHRKSYANAMPIRPRPEPVELPDSTDFVCGTLDEDRPMEQAFLNQRKLREAAKHKARPQDIDPTFPTSDPEMDEEDDEDLEDPEESDDERFLHGNLEELDDGDGTARRISRIRSGSHLHRSPPPPRRKSPAPGALKRVPTGTARSPPPPPRARSPAPAALMKAAPTARSPPPTKRGNARSPPPRKFFNSSPDRNRSPAPVNMMTSPPNTRRASPTAAGMTFKTSNMLASRPQLTHTASLPRGGGFTLGKFNGFALDDEQSDSGAHAVFGDHKRGAIDIYKGLEKKRQRRKEKLHQKMCAKAAAKGEKHYKVKPGKGAERMREVGLELQRYRGKGEHILSM